MKILYIFFMLFVLSFVEHKIILLSPISKANIIITEKEMIVESRFPTFTSRDTIKLTDITEGYYILRENQSFEFKITTYN